MATIPQIKKDLQIKVGIAVENVKQEVVRIIWDVCMQFYGEYAPSSYIRTLQIAQEIQNMANEAVKVYSVGASFHIYVDEGALSHIRGTWTEKDVLDSVMVWGTHGGVESGTPVWTQSMGIINPKMKRIIKEKLIAVGIPVY